MELVNTGRRVRNPLQHKGFRRFQNCRHRPQQTRKYQVRTRLEISLRAIAHGFESHPLRQKPSHIKALRPYDWAFLFANLPLLHMIFGKKSGVPAGLPCVRQSQEIVHYICRGDLKLYTGISHRHLHFTRSMGDTQICDHQNRVQIALFP